ncbi:hypothetical protein [Variovorax boronicumulans]|uniref:hypothetical protein n=1 Tax=Variovorax boronicumulans TaxID=436515 RepID=UPI00078181F6|nr:hypothetical protein [Variovorax boronicumulans]
MNTADRPIRKAWAIYLVAYAIFFVVLFYPYLQFVGSFGLIQIVSTLLDLVAMVCLFRHVRRKPIPTLGFRVALIAIALLFAARAAVVVFLLLSNLLPWQGGAEQWVALSGLAGVLFQTPMAAALVLYAMGSQARASEARRP